ncbi:hypothetical protein GCM10010123_22740 [Pilimelia anulata]|uniref:Uncharacterized protein n=1 Tax=Pilimelia anulata TaxID=53371 RepID=A0A8J3F870_9ACTN|nr:hypothetical protein GCM10010123_22740 [Pilimelia anulata]
MSGQSIQKSVNVARTAYHYHMKPWHFLALFLCLAPAVLTGIGAAWLFRRGRRRPDRPPGPPR